MTPTVSIVMAAYRARDHIETSVRSALSQTLNELEVIVVDDGSDDGTAEAVERIGDSRIAVIRQKNAGQSAALNRGASEARGDYVKFLDADDWLNPAHIAAQLEVLTKPRQIASCRWGYFVSDPPHPDVRTEHTNRDYDDPLDWLVDSLALDEGMMGGWMWLIPREVLEKSGGWDERLSLNNDFDFSVRLLLASSGVCFAGDAVYSYRKGVAGALSGQSAEKAMRSAFATTESGCRHLLAREDSPRVRRVCADRWQWWLYRFYPDYPELAERAEREVARLGGSDKAIEGGKVLEALVPILGWKRARRLQSRAYRLGWRPVLRLKSGLRTREMERRIARAGDG